MIHPHRIMDAVDEFAKATQAEARLLGAPDEVWRPAFRRARAAYAVVSGLVLLGMYALLFVAFRNQRHALIVLVNLPLALVGGVFAAAVLGDGVLSVASLVGFITLFGIATRNGVLLVSHYQHLIREEGLALSAAVVQGSRERLAPVLMTALTAGLALIPWS